MKKLFHTLLLLGGILLTAACSKDDGTTDSSAQNNEEYVESQLREMTLQEKVCQMFWIRPENLSADALIGVTSGMKAADEEYPVGGIILYAKNATTPSQLLQFVPALKALRYSPLICIDEEGGKVARLANNSAFNLNKYESMTWLCQHGGAPTVYSAASYIGSYLKEYGIDVDFAPVADVNSNPANPVIGTRAFSSDPDSVATMVCSYLDGLNAQGIVGCIKHFPGHGDTKTDTHYGYAETQKTWEQMLQCEMIPFRAGIQHGVQLIMTAHITAPNVDSNQVPSTLSSVILQEKLRGELGYQNIIVTDGMEMGAIVKNYTPETAAILAIQAGADVILVPQSYQKTIDAVVQAVQAGTLSESRITESARRILLLKRSRL